jgi:hypothetical protein
MKDTADAAAAAINSSTQNTRNSVTKTPSLIEIFSRAMSDCLDDEMVALNQDIKDDVFISGIKNLISDEFNYDEEFREDGNIIMGKENEDCRQDNMLDKKMKSNNDDDDRDHLAMLQSLVAVDQKNNAKDRADTTTTSDAPSKNDHDDERSDFLIIGSKGQGIFNTMAMAEIPSLIEFKQKKRRSRPNQYQHNHHYQYQQQQQDVTTTGSYNDGNNNKNVNNEKTMLEHHHGNQRQRMMKKNNDQHQHRYNQINQNNQDITTNTTNTNYTTTSNKKLSRWRNRKRFYLLSFRNKNKN